MYATAWITAEGMVNFRDLALMPAIDPRNGQPAEVQPLRLLRADNLQTLTDQSVRQFVTELNVTDVLDLRTELERDLTGPSPIEANTGIEIHPLSLYVEASTDGALPDQGNVNLEHKPDANPDIEMPWGDDWSSHEPESEAAHIAFLARHYLAFLEKRPENILAALKVIAYADGATVVHCAAGKDRTGTIVALALTLAGVPRDFITYDYGQSNTRLLDILRKLANIPAYAIEVENNADAASQATPPGAMAGLLAAVDEKYGSVANYLAGIGWTETDTAALQAKLLDPVPVGEVRCVHPRRGPLHSLWGRLKSAARRLVRS